MELITLDGIEHKNHYNINGKDFQPETRLTLHRVEDRPAPITNIGPRININDAMNGMIT